MIIPKKWKMLTKEHTILEPFVKEPWKKFTFKEVKRLSRNKSDSYVHTTLKGFVKSGILQEQRIGNNIIYFINNTVSSLNTFGFIAEYKAGMAKLPHKNLQKLIGRIKTAFYVFIVTGSYAKNRQKEGSDLDVIVVCDNKQEPNAILSQIRLESELMVPEVHPYVFTQDQMYQMLAAKEENYGKEAARNNLIITGGKEYFSILMEAIEHGFNG